LKGWLQRSSAISSIRQCGIRCYLRSAEFRRNPDVIEVRCNFHRIDRLWFVGGLGPTYPNGRHNVLFKHERLAHLSDLHRTCRNGCAEHSMDGSMNVAAQTSTTLFKGAVPPNAFMVRVPGTNANGNGCVVNDNGPANGNPLSGFILVPDLQLSTATFITPPGYKPIGPVSIWCTVPQYVAARGW
jgi:hypothetical protein